MFSKLALSATAVFAAGFAYAYHRFCPLAKAKAKDDTPVKKRSTELCMEEHINQLVKSTQAFSLIGTGSKTQFESEEDAKMLAHKFLGYMIEKSEGRPMSLLTWGDSANVESPDVGLVGAYIKKFAEERGADLTIAVLTIDGAARYGSPSGLDDQPFVDVIAFHNKYPKDSKVNKYGGVDKDGIPQSNSAKLVALLNQLYAVFVAGPVGPIGLAESKLVYKNYGYLVYGPAPARYNGDGKTYAEHGFLGVHHETLMELANETL